MTITTTFNRTEIANLFEVSDRTVDRWLLAGLTSEKGDDNQHIIKVKDVSEFLLKKQKDSFLVDDDGSMLDVDMERAKLCREQRVAQRYKNEKTNHDTVSRAQMNKLISTCIIQNKSHLEQLPYLVSNRLNLTDDQRDSITQVVKKLLNSFSVVKPI